MFVVRKMILICSKHNILNNSLHGSITKITNRHLPSLAATELANVVLTLVKSSLQPSSIPTYKRSKLFYQLVVNTLPGTSADIPISPPTLALFIAYIFEIHYASSTVNTYISAIGYSQKLKGIGRLTFAATAGSQLLCQFCIG